jgi:hypothetical protein
MFQESGNPNWSGKYVPFYIGIYALIETTFRLLTDNSELWVV